VTPVLHIRLLGAFVLTYDGEMVARFHSPRLQSLLSYLVLHADAPQPRQYLAYLFWPESEEKQARKNLRKLLTNFRDELPDYQQFLIDKERTGTVQWNPDSPYSADVAELDRLFALADKQPLTREDNIHIIDLYKGNLLPGCYEEWITPLRNQYQRNIHRTFEHLLTQLENARAYEEGIRYAQRLLDLDPIEETSYQRLMRLRMLIGDRAGALRTYIECKAILQKELGVEPSAATKKTYEQLIDGSSSDVVEGSSPIAGVAANMTKLVAREREWQVLQKTWRQVLPGRAMIVLVSGEAGIGKTRLAEELLMWGSIQGVLTARTRSYAAQGALAYAPLIQLLRTPSLYKRLKKANAVWLVELARLLPELLETHPNLPRAEPMTERWQRQRLYEALVQALLVDEQPLLLLYDDLQWCDQETLEWLQYLMTARRTARLLIVGTVRAGEATVDHPLHALTYSLRLEDCLTEIELTPLTINEVRLLAEHVAGNPLTAAQTASLYAESEGNPLFVVEIVQALVGHEGDRPVFTEAQVGIEGQVNALPPKVAAVIQARLAQLSPAARDLVAIAAAIGRSFTFTVLSEASALAEDIVANGLDELCQRRIVKEQRADIYDFSHDRIRDVAYSLQGRARRQLLHRQIGAALTRLYAGNLDVVAGELAAHAEHAGQIDQAIKYLRRAAEVAQSVGAYSDAVTLLRRGLHLLQGLNSARESVVQQELAILVPLGAALIALRGYADPEVQAVYSQAQQICATIIDDPYLMPILIGLSLFYMVRGELQQALSITQQSLLLAQQTQDTSLLLEGHVTRGAILVYLAQFHEAQVHLEQGVALYDPSHHHAHAAVYGQDPGVACHMYLALCLWYLGYADRSLSHLQEGLALARTISHPYTLNLVHCLATWLYHMRQEPVAAQTSATADIELARQYGFQLWLTIGILVQGWATIRMDTNLQEGNSEREASIAQMLDAFAGFQQTGAGLSRGYYLGFIAEAQAAVLMIDAALITVNEALTIARSCEDRYFLADVQRLWGDLLLLERGNVQSERESEAEAAFIQAIETAQAQGAKLLELRAVTSLARLWIHQGKADRAYSLLKPTVGWFTEGYDTPALQEAQSLLKLLE
jgi:DNA-binding SARP family transcriptional activator/tetratricopeptide (TPR) repeat protein